MIIAIYSDQHHSDAGFGAQCYEREPATIGPETATGWTQTGHIERSYARQTRLCALTTAFFLTKNICTNLHCKELVVQSPFGLLDWTVAIAGGLVAWLHRLGSSLAALFWVHHLVALPRPKIVHFMHRKRWRIQYVGAKQLPARFTHRFQSYRISVCRQYLSYATLMRKSMHTI